MKLFEVKYEEDGETVKAPGVPQTEIKRCSVYYVADSIEAVWKEVGHLRTDPERRLMAVGEVWPMVMVIPSSEQRNGDPNG